MDLRDLNFSLKMDRETALTLALLGVFLIVLTVFAFNAVAEVSSQQNEYDTYVQVNESDGENISAGIDTGAGLEFGEMVNGTNMTKTVNLESPELAYVEVFSEGNISEDLVYKDEMLFVNSTEVPVMYVSEEPGYYQGNITLEIKTAQNSWGERWLELLYRLPF